MCMGGSPSAPPPAAALPEAPTTPEPTDVDQTARDRRRQRLAAGTTGTILTGPRGVVDGAATSTKTLLGQ
jgi:hypothetical protein